MVHWIACLFHFLSSIVNYAEDTWVVRIGIENENLIYRWAAPCALLGGSRVQLPVAVKIELALLCLLPTPGGGVTPS